MALEDKALGSILLLISTLVFGYYTMWTLVLPFVDVGHPFQKFFPDRWYAVSIPLALLVIGLSGISSLIALVMIKSSKGKKVVPPPPSNVTLLPNPTKVVEKPVKESKKLK